MTEVFHIADNIFSPLGATTSENFLALQAGKGSIRKFPKSLLSPVDFYGSLFENEIPAPPGAAPQAWSGFERLVAWSVKDALDQAGLDPHRDRIAFILSTTKGDIQAIEKAPLDGEGLERIGLPAAARRLSHYFGFSGEPIVVSQACISGILGIVTAQRLLQSGSWEHAVVVGADRISRFVLSGFQSFQAVSPFACRPFDAQRAGVSLGEAAATVVLSVHPGKGPRFRIRGGAITNDANHISGPSRTGAELALAIHRALDAAGSAAGDTDFISAHGTATLYNDEMESKAIHLAGLQGVPVNSLKGYYGHTLGAAGVLETVVSIRSLREGFFPGTLGFKEPGTSQILKVSDQPVRGRFRQFVKTGSGFGGCNAALVVSMDNDT